MEKLDSIFNILNRTPAIIKELCSELPSNLSTVNEGNDTWSVFDIIGHLNHGERTDWIPRMELILSSADNKKFEEFDRFAQFRSSRNKNLAQLIEEFEELRENNLFILSSYELIEIDMKKTGIHPDLGEVTLEMLLTTWAVHDLDHIAQISRVIANQFKNDVGPWTNYLRIIKD